ncbi:hypothetical protein K7432_006608 [Basidiobolus ranarum]|uniref:Uncharacterized protein n=1 Tax=Basidiobolus ranarum TaxID=34480 RepID=A0ABR2WUP6_9FUNG
MSYSQKSYKAYSRNPKSNDDISDNKNPSSSEPLAHNFQLKQTKTPQSKSFSNSLVALFGRSQTTLGDKPSYANKSTEVGDISSEVESISNFRPVIEASRLPEREAIPQLNIYHRSQAELEAKRQEEPVNLQYNGNNTIGVGLEKVQPRSSSLKFNKDKIKKHTKGSPSIVNITKEGYLNKKADPYQGSAMGLSRSWKVYRIILKGSKLYFFKPPSESEIKSIFPSTYIEKRPLTIATSSVIPPVLAPFIRQADINEQGIPLNNEDFTNSARIMIFEPISRSNNIHMPISSPMLTDEPLSNRYCYGECFTEVDPGNFRFRRFVCLLIFQDTLMICKRKWIRSNRTNLFDAVGDAIRFGSSSGSFDENSGKGYYTKWKHDTMLPIERIDIIEASSTSFSYSKSSSNRSTLFSLSNSSASSLSGSSLEPASENIQAIQVFVTGPNSAQRLFVAKTNEQRIAWLTKFNAIKNSHDKKAVKKSNELPRVAESRLTTVDTVDHLKILNAEKSEPTARRRLYWDTTQHPELVLSNDVTTGDPSSYVIRGGTVDSLIHELVFGNVTNLQQKRSGEVDISKEDFIDVFLSTYCLFTSPSYVLREIQRCIGMVIIDGQLNEQGREILERLVGTLQVWLLGFTEDMDDKSMKEMESLVKNTIRKHKVPGHEKLVEILQNLKKISPKFLIPTEQPIEEEDCSLQHLILDMASLGRSGLTPALFLKIPAHDFAEQLYIFHNRHRTKITDQNMLHIRDFLAFNESSNIPIDLKKSNPFTATLSNPHFLTKLIHVHLVTTARSMHSTRRSAILLHWIRTGIACQQLDDMTSWASIALGICSPAVVRLRETWKGVPDELKVHISSEWIPRLVDYGLYDTEISNLTGVNDSVDGTTTPVMIRGQIPYFGGIKQSIERIEKLLPAVLHSETGMKRVNLDKYYQMYSVFVRAKREWHHFCERPFPTHPKTTSFEPLQRYFDGMLYDDDPTMEFDVNHVFQCSLDSEPPINSRYYEEIYKSHTSCNLGYQPLQFPMTAPFSPSYLEMIATFLAIQPEPNSNSNEEWLSGSPASYNNLKGLDHILKNGLKNGDTAAPLYIDVHQARKRTRSLTSIITTPKPISPIENKSGWWRFTQKLYDQQYCSNTNWILDLLNRNELLLFASNKELVFKIAKTDFLELGNTPSILRVDVKGGTLDRIIDILVFGVQHFSEELGTESGHPFAIGKSYYVEIDEDEYLETFFLSYRSFCIPSALVDHLRKRYMKAKKTAKGSIERDYANLGSVSRIKLKIISILEYWLKNHFHDFLDSLESRNKVCTFLDTVIKLEAANHSQGNDDLDDHLSDELINFANRLKKFIVATSLKPSFHSVQREKISITKLNLSSDSECSTVPPDLRFSPSPISLDSPHTAFQNLDVKPSRELLTVINQHVFDLFSPISLYDWVYIVSDLELQTIDPLAWYPRKKPSPVADDEVIISDIFIAIEHCRHSVSSSSNSQARNTLFSTAPSSIVSLFRIHEAIKVWVISEIASLTIDYKLRVSRIEKFVEMIILCRNEMAALGPNRMKAFSRLTVGCDIGEDQKLYVPSFVETAIIAGLISPESRAFTKAWNDVSQNLNGGLDTLQALINGCELDVASGSPCVPRFPAIDIDANSEPLGLIPSLGWMIESVLEIIHYLPDLLFASGHLINFDKRLHIYHLISSFHEWTMHDQSGLSQGIDMSFLTSQSGYATKPDLRQVKEFALRENSLMRYSSNSGTTVSSWSSAHQAISVKKVFPKLVYEEQENFKRDQKERERLEREARENQLNLQRKKNEEAKVLGKRVKEQQLRRAKIKELEMMTNLMKTVLTTDSVCGNSNETSITDSIPPHMTTLPDPIRTNNGDSQTLRISSLPSFLSKVPSVKPSLAINLINSTITVEHSYAKRDHVFKVVSEEGCQYFLQAIDRQDMTEWVQAINNAAKEAASRRITILVEDAQKEVIEQERSSTNNTTSSVLVTDSRSVFGIELEEIMESNGKYTIPILVEKCLSEVECRGLCEVGIYRLSGMTSSIERLRQEFNKDSNAVDLSDEEWTDINIISGLLKQWLRELPSPLLSFKLYDDFISAVAIRDYDERLFAIKDLVHALPPPHYMLLKRLVEHLEMITDYEDVNHMYASNLAIVFGPTILRPPPGPASFATSMANLGQHQSIVRNLILQYHWIFDVEADVEADAEEGSELP